MVCGGAGRVSSGDLQSLLTQPSVTASVTSTGDASLRGAPASVGAAAAAGTAASHSPSAARAFVRFAAPAPAPSCCQPAAECMVVPVRASYNSEAAHQQWHLRLPAWQQD